ncbi:hypothetical protein SAMN06269185_3197 [Natronoarchaeum philippinense]|uniref:Zinc-ribbon domain-containing protein n=1 Tax=Natronoarchaeum philippinense TaxID=558529 RepID=A0A285P8E1_NATPI|nr:hypothetical protein [Natronoarchaeum philippinense]SNZ18009.1 hypothetical protein SAMN06269185_3197 [Natronoarchaeum philippinense]
MSVLDRLLGSFGGEDRLVVYECRRCGTSIDASATNCPECGEAEIVRYEL